MANRPPKQDAPPLAKLTKEPIAHQLRVGGQVVEAFIAPLTYMERIQANATANEAYSCMKEGGAKHDDCLHASTVAIMLMTAYFCTRRGPGHDASRLFQRPEEVQALSSEALLELLEKHNTEFVLTEDELGNSLRERAATCTTSTSSPASSTPE